MLGAEEEVDNFGNSQFMKRSFVDLFASECEENYSATNERFNFLWENLGTI